MKNPLCILIKCGRNFPGASRSVLIQYLTQRCVWEEKFPFVNVGFHLCLPKVTAHSPPLPLASEDCLFLERATIMTECIDIFISKKEIKFFQIFPLFFYDQMHSVIHRTYFKQPRIFRINEKQ